MLWGLLGTKMKRWKSGCWNLRLVVDELLSRFLTLGWGGTLPGSLCAAVQRLLRIMPKHVLPKVVTTSSTSWELH